MATKAKFKFPAVLKDLTELPEAVRTIAEDLYEKEGEEYVFQGFDESEAKKKLDEFRANNRKYYKRVQELEAQTERFKDIDPDKYQAGLTALEKMQAIQEKNLIEEGKLEDVVKQRVAAAVEPYERAAKAKDQAYNEAVKEKDTYRQELNGLVIDGLVSRVAGKVGKIKKGALPHILGYGRQIWKLGKDGKPKAYKPDGTEWYGKNGDPITEEEWGSKLLEEANFYFETGQGGGANGADGNESGTRQEGAVKYIDRTNPTLMAKYHKEIIAGTVVAQ
jgi:hypothetical protein